MADGRKTTCIKKHACAVSGAQRKISHENCANSHGSCRLPGYHAVSLQYETVRGRQSDVAIAVRAGRPFVPLLVPASALGFVVIKSRVDWTVATSLSRSFTVPASIFGVRALKVTMWLNSRQNRTRKQGRTKWRKLSLEILECRLALSNIPLNATTWTNLGPAPMGSIWNRRVMAIAPDPTDANIIYLGASSGGVWKSTNAGASWTPLTDSQAVLTTGSLAIDPTNHLTVYAGTGDWSTAPGMGVLKTTNGGSTWTLLGQSQFNGKSITDVVIDPTNTNHLYLSAIPGGVYQSFDGGSTWANIFSADTFFSLVMAANNPQVLYGSSNYAGGVWKTINGGSTWTQLSAPHGGRVVQHSWRSPPPIPTSCSPPIGTTAREARTRIALSMAARPGHR